MLKNCIKIPSILLRYHYSQNYLGIIPACLSTSTALVASVVSIAGVIIGITTTVIGIGVVWKRNKRKQHNRQEGVYCSTTDEKTSKVSSEYIFCEINHKQDSEELQNMKNFQCTKQASRNDDLAYSISHHQDYNFTISSKGQDKMQTDPDYCVLFKSQEAVYSFSSEHQQVKMQDDLAYFISSDHQGDDPTKFERQVKLQNDPAYSTSSDCQVKLQNDSAYSTSSECQVKLQNDPAYSRMSSKTTK